MHDFKVGDVVLFDHFGSKDRKGTVVKLTANSVHVEWTAPASGITRVVKLSTKLRPQHWYDGKFHQEASPDHTTSEFLSKNVRRVGGQG